MTYRRSAGSPRGEARRRELLDLVTEDLAVNGLVDFSLRRAARTAGTTHKVLLYHFASAEDLLERAVERLREQRISRSLGAAAEEPTLAGRVRALWPVLTSGESWVLDQAIGLAIYDVDRHGGLARGGTQQYLPALVSLCPPGWSEPRKAEVAAMVLATLRGFLIDLRTSGGDPVSVEAGFVALSRALDREEAAG